MTAYNVVINRLDMPARMLRLPVDDRGYPVPRFVKWFDGKPDFRVIDSEFLGKAVRHKLCWLCGDKLGRYSAFVLGPMCAINRISSEPPSHLDCARFAVKACPFLTQPNRVRNAHDLPLQKTNPGGLMIPRNPGVALIWITESYRVFQANGLLFAVGDPVATEWYAHGAKATRAQIMHSIETGLPILREVAEKEGADALAALDEQVKHGLALVPA